MKLFSLQCGRNGGTGSLPTIHTSRSGSRTHVCAKAYRPENSQGSPSDSNNSLMLEAFFIGRAAAAVFNERAGSAVADFLANVGTAEADFRRAMSDFQEDVLTQARQEMSQSTGMTLNYFSQTQSTVGGKLEQKGVDIVEVVDELRAELATARASLQVLKQKK